MKNEKLKSEIYSLETAVLKVVEQCKKVASMTDIEPDLLEELQQIAIALHYTMQTLRAKADLPNVSVTRDVPGVEVGGGGLLEQLAPMSNIRATKGNKKNLRVI